MLLSEHVQEVVCLYREVCYVSDKEQQDVKTTTSRHDIPPYPFAKIALNLSGPYP